MQFCRLPMKYSGAALYDGGLSTHGIIFSEFLSTPLHGSRRPMGHNPRPPNIFSGLDCFQSVRVVELRRQGYAFWHSKILSHRLTIKSGVQDNEYPIVSGTKMLNLKDMQGLN